jgi:hypothetical protein
MELDEEYILEIPVDAAMVAERLTPSDFDERYRKDMEGGYRPEVIEAKRRYFGDPARLSLERTMATENGFNVGDVVMLKTGGPRRTCTLPLSTARCWDAASIEHGCDGVQARYAGPL